MSKSVRSLAASLIVACRGLVLSAMGASAETSLAEVRDGLEGLTTSPGGPPGAIAALYRKLTTISVGHRRRQAGGDYYARHSRGHRPSLGSISSRPDPSVCALLGG